MKWFESRVISLLAKKKEREKPVSFDTCRFDLHITLVYSRRLNENVASVRFETPDF